MGHELERTHLEAHLGGTLDLSLALEEAELIRELDRAEAIYRYRDMFLQRIAEMGTIVLEDILVITEEFMEGEAVGHKPVLGQMVFEASDG